jgi:hypothetical protein
MIPWPRDRQPLRPGGDLADRAAALPWPRLRGGGAGPEPGAGALGRGDPRDGGGARQHRDLPAPARGPRGDGGGDGGRLPQREHQLHRARADHARPGGHGRTCTGVDRHHGAGGEHPGDPSPGDAGSFPGPSHHGWRRAGQRDRSFRRPGDRGGAGDRYAAGGEAARHQPPARGDGLTVVGIWERGSSSCRARTRTSRPPPFW